MTQDRGAAEADAAAATQLGPGAQLAAARVRAGITPAEVAERLRLDPPALAALEADKFETFGASVFVRGHLRRYAELVGLSPHDLDAAYEASNECLDRPELNASAKPMQRASFAPRPFKPQIAVVAAVLVVLVAAVWWALRLPHRQARAPSETVPVTTPASGPASAPATESLPGAAPAPPAAAAPAATDTAGAAAAPAVSPVASGVLAPGEVRLQIHFGQNSWTEIYDAKGRQVFFGLGAAGSTQDLTGKPPLRILFGNPEGVRVLLNGHPVGLGERPEGAPLRFSLDGGGRVVELRAAHG